MKNNLGHTNVFSNEPTTYSCDICGKYLGADSDRNIEIISSSDSGQGREELPDLCMRCQNDVLDGFQNVIRSLKKTSSVECKHSKTKTTEQISKTGVKQLKKTCSTCGKFLGFESYLSDDEFIMPYGKHKGTLLREIDTDYLKWLSENSKGSLKKRVERIINQ